MAAAPSVAILRDIKTLFDVGTAAGMTDRQLLERFSDRSDASSDAAFEVLILRHGPMILRVCRNTLRDEADVADAFQATFLVLVKRRETLGSLESVGGWLYGVACRVAARVRVDAARRLKAEQRAALRVVEAVDQAEERSMAQDFGPVVQEEVRRLPEKYRAVVVLCYWQSFTHDAAAAQLGCPLGTVRSRLARARKLLQRRLTRRGSAPLAGIVTKVLDCSTAPLDSLFPVPAALLKQTIQASAAAAAGGPLRSIVSGTAASLVYRIHWSMATMKIKTVAGLVVVGFIGISAGMVLSTGRHSHGQVTSVAQPQGAELPKDPPGTAPLRSNARDVRTILTLLSNGAIVRNGDVVCELDSAELAESMTNQRIATIHAQTTHRRNETALEIARLNLDEYEKGVTVLEQQEMQAAVDKAEADLGAAEGRFAATKSDKDETARRDARTALELAQSRRDVLLHYTKAKRIKELKLAIEVAEAEVQASAQVGMLEQSKEKAIEREIAACTMVASRDGKLVYYYGAEGSKPRIGYKPDGSTAPWPFIGVGAQVLPQQLLFKVIPVDEDPARSR